MTDADRFFGVAKLAVDATRSSPTGPREIVGYVDSSDRLWGVKVTRGEYVTIMPYHAYTDLGGSIDDIARYERFDL